MHGLVAVDNNRKVLRPAIIWCDSRAVEIGNQAFSKLGKAVCLEHLLNSPGNFTASKLKWVKDNEPDLFKRIDKILLPGDYIAMRLTGEAVTTESGLSEGILWDFKKNELAKFLLAYFGIPADIIPPTVPTFSVQGYVTKDAAEELGFRKGIKVSYRAGGQSNNALSLQDLNPGEVAANAGTSGVIYGILNKAVFDPLSRVNTFVHVNHCLEKPRYGILLCLNGTGILYSWLKNNIMTVNEMSLSYDDMNNQASLASPGSGGLMILPFGNGAERTLENKNIGAAFWGLDFNKHNKAHILRAAQEGIIFALNYGFEIMKTMGVRVETVKAGRSNMFLSSLFTKIFSTVIGAPIEIFNTDGSQGAARGAGIGAGIYTNENAFIGLKTVKVVEPDKNMTSFYQETYAKWSEILNNYIG